MQTQIASGELVIEPKAKRTSAPDPFPDTPEPTPVPMRVSPPGASIVPAKRQPIPGYPCPERCAALTAARRRYEELLTKWRDAYDAAGEAFAKFGLLPGQHHNTAAIEKVVVESIAKGEPVESAEDLDRLYKAERRLYAAAESVAKDIAPLHRASVCRLNDEVRRRLLPSLRKLTLAKIAAVQAAAEHRDAVHAVANAGFTAEPYHVHGGSVHLNPNDAVVDLRELHRLGVITDAELRRVTDMIGW